MLQKVDTTHRFYFLQQMSKKKIVARADGTTHVYTQETITTLYTETF